jgi:osmotically-inducible protein OsmY
MNAVLARPEGGVRVRRATAAFLLAALLSACVAFAPDNRRDARITAQVQALFAETGGLQAPNLISVQTRKGVVYLYGLVNTPFEQALATSVARQVPGVKQVQNLIGLSGSR